MKKKTKKVKVKLTAHLERKYVHYDREIIALNDKKYSFVQDSKTDFNHSILYPSFEIDDVKRFFQQKEPSETSRNFPAIFNKNILEEELNRNLYYVKDFDYIVDSVEFTNPVYICPFSKIVWMDTKEFGYGKEVFSSSHYQLKYLPKSDYYVCEKQRYEATQYLKTV